MSARWWHGGVPGLAPGALLLPPCESGHAEPMAESRAVLGVLLGIEPDRNRDDRVYLAGPKQLGRAYAAVWGYNHGRPGALYAAEPVGPWEPDPDLPETSVQCARARVVAVCDPAVRMPRRKVQAALLAGTSYGPADVAALAAITHLLAP